MREKQFENKIKDYLKKLPKTWHFKIWSGGFSKSGIPDIIACVNGRFVAIEVKAEKGTPSELQKWNIENIKKAGGVGVILYPNQWEEFKAVLDGLV